MANHSVQASKKLQLVELDYNQRVLVCLSIRDGWEVQGPQGRFLTWREQTINSQTAEIPLSAVAIVVFARHLTEGEQSKIHFMATQRRGRFKFFRFAYSIKELKETLPYIKFKGIGEQAGCLQLLSRPEIAFVDAVPLWHNPKLYHAHFDGHRNAAPVDRKQSGTANVYGHRSSGRRLVDFVAQELIVGDNRTDEEIAKSILPQAKALFPNTTLGTLRLRVKEARLMNISDIRY
ncbi:MAG: hypothetical protein KBD66_01480 [Candidatus Doudnabacteria bacterium]|nr:hypothetical protein [Candidatus Doudnabacteria bacterium]